MDTIGCQHQKPATLSMLTTLYFPQMAMKLAINQNFSMTMMVATMVEQFVLFLLERMRKNEQNESKKSRQHFN